MSVCYYYFQIIQILSEAKELDLQKLQKTANQLELDISNAVIQIRDGKFSFSLSSMFSGMHQAVYFRADKKSIAFDSSSPWCSQRKIHKSFQFQETPFMPYEKMTKQDAEVC